MGTHMIKKRKSGFANMDLAKRREIASMGGKKAHELNKAHRFTSQEALQAVKKTRHYRKKNEN